jgi:hypothetical protein
MHTTAAETPRTTTGANNDDAHQTIVVRIKWPTAPLQVQLVPPPPESVKPSYRFDQMGSGHSLGEHWRVGNRRRTLDARGLGACATTVRRRLVSGIQAEPLQG